MGHLPTAIGVDLGGTKCAAGVVRWPEGRVLTRRLHSTRPERGGEAVLSDVIEIVRSLAEEARREGAAPACVGIGVPELVNPAGEVLSDATIKWKWLGVAARFRAAIGLPVAIEADVRAAARGEAMLGAGCGFTSFLYVTVGTGISASVVVNHTPYAGARGLTGTFASSGGLIPAHGGGLASGPPLEQFAAGPALAARLAAVRPGFTGGSPEVLALAAGGDAQARQVVVSAGQALGAAIAQLVNIVDPEAVILGGGLGLAGGLYRETLDEAMRKHVWSEWHHELPILPAELGNDAGLIGAALAATMLESE